MVLDEPENHLDVDTVDALAVVSKEWSCFCFFVLSFFAQALNDYNGAVVVVSHDERLVSLCVNELWVVDSGSVSPWEKDWDAYRKTLEKELSF